MARFPERFVLASGSPRRRQMLEALKVPFEVRPSGAEETMGGGEAPIQLVARLALAKARDVAGRLEPAPGATIVFGCDTVVVLGGEVFGKPSDMEEARAMIRKLQGRTHMVYSGIGLVKLEGGRREELTSFGATEVTMCHLDEAEIQRYFSLENPLDKAGAYAIQGGGSLIISAIEGCYYNVLGLPVRELENLLRQWGYSLFAAPSN